MARKIPIKNEYHGFKPSKTPTAFPINSGMTKPEQRRLWKAFHRRYPPTLMGRLKKKVLSRIDSPQLRRRKATTEDNQSVMFFEVVL